MALKAVLADTNAVSRGLLNTVLTNASYEVVAEAHTSARTLALVVKHQPHFVCIDRALVEDGENVVEAIHEALPKTLVFMVSSALDAQTIQQGVARGISAFIVKPFNADAVTKTIRNAVLAMIKKQQQA